MTEDYLNQIETLLRERLEAGDVDAIVRLGAILDAADAEQGMPDLHTAALAYAARGIPVFPCKPTSKQPATPRGFKDASTDPDTINAWWNHRPLANIGTPTGIGFDVIDIDGPEGIRTLVEHLALDAMPEAIATVSTPRDGGIHWYVPASGWGNKTKIYPGIDYRGDGGYVLLPPSVTDEHGPGRSYRWLNELGA